MAASPTIERTALSSITVTRSEQGFDVKWQREGRPTRRQFSDLGTAIGQAFALSAWMDAPVIDMTDQPVAD